MNSNEYKHNNPKKGQIEPEKLFESLNDDIKKGIPVEFDLENTKTETIQKLLTSFFPKKNFKFQEMMNSIENECSNHIKNPKMNYKFEAEKILQERFALTALELMRKFFPIEFKILC